MTRLALAEPADGVPPPRPRAGPHPGEPGLTPLGASQRDRLERVLVAGLVERGSVFMLSLAPVREQSGGKWDARKEQIWERTERSLAANLPVEDVCLRIDDVSILVAVASCPAYEGQVRCVRVLREIMTHFLGRLAHEDIRLSRVTSASGDELTVESIDVSAPPDPGHRQSPLVPPAMKNPDLPGRWTPPLAGRSYAAPFANIRGDAVEMKLLIVPVWCLRRGVISSYAIRRAYPYLQQPTSDFDQEAADVQTVRRTVEILREYQQSGGAFALHVPVHFATAASRRSRINLLGLCADVLPVMRQAAIFEVEKVDNGVPFSRLQEAVSMCSPFARAIMVGLREGERLNPFIRDCGFSGVAIAANPAAATLSSLRYLVARTRRITPNIVVHSVDAAAAIETQLASLGASHMTVAPTA